MLTKRSKVVQQRVWCDLSVLNIDDAFFVVVAWNEKQDATVYRWQCSETIIYVNNWLIHKWFRACTCGGRDKNHWKSWTNRRLPSGRTEKNQLHTWKKINGVQIKSIQKKGEKTLNTSAMCKCIRRWCANSYANNATKAMHSANLIFFFRCFFFYCHSVYGSLCLLARVDGHSTKLHDKRVKFLIVCWRNTEKIIKFQ